MKLRQAFIAVALLTPLAYAFAQAIAVVRTAVGPTTLVVPEPPPAATLSPPWLQTDIGTPPFPGSATDSAGVLTIRGSGDINDDHDSGHQIYQEQSGDYTVESCVASLSGSSVYRAVGPSVRDLGPTEDSAYCWIRLDGNLTSRFQWKPNNTDFFDNWVAGPSITYPYCTRIVYSGGVCSGYVGATANTTTTLVGSAPITFSGTKFYGVTIGAGGGSTEGLATSTLTMPALTAAAGSTGAVQFSLSTQTQGENVTPLVLTVTRSGGTTGAASVVISNAGGGSAVAGTDFTNVFPATLNWAAGDGANKTQNVALIDRAAVQASRTLNVSLGTVTGATLGSPSTQAVTITDNDGNQIRQHPGHYALPILGVPGVAAGYWLDRSDVQAQLTQFVANGVCPQASIKGIQVFATWKTMEGNTAGSFTSGKSWVNTLGTQLRNCSSGPKYLQLAPVLGYFGGVPSRLTIWPAYLVATSEGGTDAAGTYGIVDGTPGYYAQYPRFWNAATMDRWIATWQSYCTDYDDDRWLEQINTGLETSINLNAGDGGFSYNGLMTQMGRLIPAMRTACPHVSIRLHANYIDSNQHMIDAMVLAAANQVTVGGPDTLPHEDIQANRAYRGELGGGVDYKNIIPFASEVESPELCDARDSKPGADEFNNYTMAEFYGHAFNGNPAAGISDVDPTYFVWYVDQKEYCDVPNQWWGAAPSAWTDLNTGGMLDFIQTNQPLNTLCHSSYTNGCDTAP